jgi:hypothetical protein
MNRFPAYYAFFLNPQVERAGMTKFWRSSIIIIQLVLTCGSYDGADDGRTHENEKGQVWLAASRCHHEASERCFVTSSLHVDVI